MSHKHSFSLYGHSERDPLTAIIPKYFHCLAQNRRSLLFGIRRKG